MKSRIGICVMAWLVAQPVFADTISPAKANGDFISGTGIPNGDFTVATAATGESVALRVRSRDTGLPLAEVGNKYYVSTGNSALTPSQPWWEFDLQFSPGATAGKPASAYDITLSEDYNPAVGAATFVTNTFQASLDVPDLYTNPGSGAWDTNAVTYVLSNSLNLSFGTHPPYNPNTPGEYEIQLSVSDHITHAVLATVDVFAEVSSVPAPPSIILLGTGLVCGGFTQVFRRIRRG